MGARSPKTSDRRIRKTRDALHGALLALMTERGWDDFTVQDLCDRADVGRSTFYMHYADKEDLLKGGFEEFRQGVRQQVASQKRPGNRLGFARAVLEHAHQQAPAFRALLGKGSGQAVVWRFRELVVDLVKDDLAAVSAPKARKAAATCFLAGGFLELLGWWLEAGSSLLPAEAEELFQALAGPVVEALRRA